MKILIYLILITGSTFSFGQAEKEVEASVEKLRVAMIDPTADELTKITSKDLSYGHSSGLLENQSQFIEALVSGKSDFKTITLSEQSVKLSGKNIALVRHKFKGELVSGSNINTVNLGILTVWVKEKGEWKLLARQAFKL
jgi:hypothetical protein